MSDVQARPAASRGRGSGRGGRGGFTSRGGRNASRSAAATNGDPKHDSESNALPTLEDQGEIGDLNKAFGSKVSLIKEVFPDWSEVDILYALKETDGDEASTIERIADGECSHITSCPASHLASSILPHRFCRASLRYPSYRHCRCRCRCLSPD